MAATDLVTLGQAKAFLGTEDSLDDELVAQIQGLSLELEGRLSTYFIQRARTEYHPGGHKRIWLNRYPVISITSITDPASNTIASDEYVVRQRRYIEFWGRWPQAVASSGQRTDWEIVFQCGLWADTDSVPADVQYTFLKCLEGVRANPTEASSVGVGDLSISFGASPGNASRSADLLSAAALSLVQYRGDFL